MAVFDINACEALMEELTAIAARAAAAIRQCGAASLRQKADGTPVTAADQAAEAVILRDLKRLAPWYPDRLGGKLRRRSGARRDVARRDVFSGRPPRRDPGIHCRT